MATKGTNVKANDFFRWFRKEVRDPLLESSGLTDGQKLFVDATLPSVIYTAVTHQENTKLAGMQKMNAVVSELKPVLIAQGLEVLMPFIKIWLEKAVLVIYRKYFVAKMTALGLNDMLEKLIGVDLDEDGDIGVPTTPPLPVVELPKGALFAPAVETPTPE